MLASCDLQFLDLTWGEKEEQRTIGNSPPKGPEHGEGEGDHMLFSLPKQQRYLEERWGGGTEKEEKAHPFLSDRKALLQLNRVLRSTRVRALVEFYEVGNTKKSQDGWITHRN